MGHELRRHRRYEVGGVEGSLQLSQDARILNMSLTGLLVETTSTLRLGSHCSLRVPQAGGELRFDAVVKWCQLVGTRRVGSDTRSVYHAGIDFREILDDRARAVLAFIEAHVIVDLERRLAGRFHALQPIAAELTSGARFEVCKLSLSGLLLRTTHPPAHDTEVGLELETPVGTVRARGRVRNLERVPMAARTSQEDVDVPWYAGVELVALEPEERRRLTRYIEALLD